MKRDRSQAEEFRVESEMMSDEGAKAQYAKRAEAFEGLTINEDKLRPKK